ncbi:DUF951 domain-containing protein [Petroclostridium sp. X23]|uniref:DUF951 domain-containing protein n=1 Tax=Petroclostridium sp. X23 TaxID=3045146 RepID=UPI0024AE7D47|nr:DUF951 domain-containing protein [Petroclostridium sp. X23]WHH57207.1 DUF951 domain-containing protein [Petroclostridium sp. X23]
MPINLKVGDIVELKKQHPCGSKQWEILRAGMDFRIKCVGCGHQVMLARPKLEKSIKKVFYSAQDATGSNGGND